MNGVSSVILTGLPGNIAQFILLGFASGSGTTPTPEPEPVPEPAPVPGRLEMMNLTRRHMMGRE